MWWTHARPFNTSVYKYLNNILAKGNIQEIPNINLHTHVRILRPPVGATTCRNDHSNSDKCIAFTR